jgi:exodeoxyribonuclease VIII
VELYELEQDAIQKGREDYLADIATYKKCVETNNWHGYTEDKSINILSLPKWAK